MTLNLLKAGALALAGMIAVASNAQAGGLYDGDDNGFSGKYNRQSLDVYCDQNPYDDACNGYDKPAYRKKVHKKRHHDNHCRALIRAAGKRNLVTAFARNSAIFAWRREVRAVHGAQYMNWNNARNAYIECNRYGGLKECVARATPCRY
jgi:hypothetical protein